LWAKRILSLGLRRKAEKRQGKQLCQETPSRHFVLSYTMDFQGNGRGELYSFFFKTSIVQPVEQRFRNRPPRGRGCL
jgi:hypothetical protein